MVTIKTEGCGGRYSYIAFLPCRNCLAHNDDWECGEIQKQFRTTKHDEWWMVK